MITPELTQKVRRLETLLDRQTPIRSWEIQTITFTAADTDQDVATSLTPANPEDVFYQVVRTSGGGVVYQDMSGARTAWQRGLIYLRCTQTITVDLLLMTLDV